MPPRRKPVAQKAAVKKRKPTLAEKVKKIAAQHLQALGNGQNAPGLVLALHSQNEHVVQSYGVENTTTKQKLSENTLFNVASITKQFTAMAVLILIERGEFAFSDDIRKFFPELKYEGITVAHLLSQTSGLREYYDICDILWKSRDGIVVNHKKDKRPTTQDVVQLYCDQTPTLAFLPGKREEYSSTSYVFLAAIIEKVSGKSFEKFLSEEIFEKLEMKNTFVYGHSESPNDKEKAYEENLQTKTKLNIALGYKPVLINDDEDDEDEDEEDDEYPQVKEWRVKVEHYLNNVFGDLGVYSTLNDLIIWSETLNTNITKLVKEETWMDGLRCVKLGDEYPNYAVGQKVELGEDDDFLYEQAGSWTGYNTFLRRIPGKKFYIVILSNIESYISFELADDLTFLVTEEDD